MFQHLKHNIEDTCILNREKYIPITKMSDTAIILHHDIAEIRHPHILTSATGAFFAPFCEK